MNPLTTHKIYLSGCVLFVAIFFIDFFVEFGVYGRGPGTVAVMILGVGIVWITVGIIASIWRSP